MGSAPDASASLRHRGWLIVGAGGMLGHALQRMLSQRGEHFEALGHCDLDITDENAVNAVIARFATTIPDDESGVVVNAAAYTNVEAAEDDPANAFRVNEGGAANLAAATRDADLGLVHVSTDFVFDGTKTGPYDEDDAPNPLSVYGASKLAGEIAVDAANPDTLIVRTAWVFGVHGSCFPAKIIAVARERGTVSVVADEVGSPTYALDLAWGITRLVGMGATGLFHLTDDGACSRFELAEATLAIAGIRAELKHVASDAFPTKAKRPANSVLDCSRAASLGALMPPWRDALERYVGELVAASAL